MLSYKLLFLCSPLLVSGAELRTADDAPAPTAEEGHDAMSDVKAITSTSAAVYTGGVNGMVTRWDIEGLFEGHACDDSTVNQRNENKYIGRVQLSMLADDPITALAVDSNDGWTYVGTMTKGFTAFPNTAYGFKEGSEEQMQHLAENACTYTSNSDPRLGAKVSSIVSDGSNFFVALGDVIAMMKATQAGECPEDVNGTALESCWKQCTVLATRAYEQSSGPSATALSLNGRSKILYIAGETLLQGVPASQTGDVGWVAAVPRELAAKGKGKGKGGDGDGDGEGEGKKGKGKGKGKRLRRGDFAFAIAADLPKIARALETAPDGKTLLAKAEEAEAVDKDLHIGQPMTSVSTGSASCSLWVGENSGKIRSFNKDGKDNRGAFYTGSNGYKKVNSIAVSGDCNTLFVANGDLSVQSINIFTTTDAKGKTMHHLEKGPQYAGNNDIKYVTSQGNFLWGCGTTGAPVASCGYWKCGDEEVEGMLRKGHCQTAKYCRGFSHKAIEWGKTSAAAAATTQEEGAEIVDGTEGGGLGEGGGDSTATDGASTDGTASDDTAENAKEDGGATDGTATDSTATDGASTDGASTDGASTDGTASDDTTAADGASTDGSTDTVTEQSAALVQTMRGAKGMGKRKVTDARRVTVDSDGQIKSQ